MAAIASLVRIAAAPTLAQNRRERGEVFIVEREKMAPARGHLLYWVSRPNHDGA